MWHHCRQVDNDPSRFAGIADGYIPVVRAYPVYHEAQRGPQRPRSLVSNLKVETDRPRFRIEIWVRESEVANVRVRASVSLSPLLGEASYLTSETPAGE